MRTTIDLDDVLLERLREVNLLGPLQSILATHACTIVTHGRSFLMFVFGRQTARRRQDRFNGSYYGRQSR